MPGRADRPKGAVPESLLFEVKSERRGETLVQTGFTDPTGHYYPLAEGEELVQIRETGAAERKTYIRKDGVETPFVDWKADK